MPANELAIGSRVRIVRQRLGLSRAEFARMIGGDSSTIGNIEHGRAPLRFDLAQRLCSRFKVNHRWLATGRLPLHYPMHYHGFDSRIAPRTPFSKAYSEFLARLTEKSLNTAAEKAGCRVEDLDQTQTRRLGGIDLDSPEAIAERERRILQWAANILGQLPPRLHEAFLSHITSASEGFFRDHSQAVFKHRKAISPGDANLYADYLARFQERLAGSVADLERMQDETRVAREGRTAKEEKAKPAVRSRKKAA